MTTQEKIAQLLNHADIEINGSRPFDLQVLDTRLYDRVLSRGSLGFGEAYMDGWWSSGQLDQLLTKLLSSNLDKKIQPWKFIFPVVKSFVMNLQTQARSLKVGEHHYDIGNDLYHRMLGQSMVYTCGYWKDTDNLDQAQENKLDLVCKKINLKSGDRILDIGCGWGSFAKFAAEKYGAEVVGITISKEQKQLAEENCAGLPVEIRLQDYREVNEKFDHIISLGMIEHVGYKNYRTYMQMVSRCLKDNGLFLLHTIGGNKSVTSTNAWIEKYIFPNSMLPGIKQLAKSFEGLFVMEDWHNFGIYYDKTLMAWYNNFTNNWDAIKDNYPPKFFKMWEFYLLSCAASFRCRKNQLWQIVLSPNGVEGGYKSIR
ncbi:cyclopropane-fatty-acyl-phospholipid synthase [Candidatus Falkowbacteria bacterium RIFOXYD2_FULL_35_9]|uniref:Cyclopropane-fatty-acyl-phospholipid synthase n=1 Tax=Candidatus Falkowbacteria bacterium RIFOXYC2_FULL_36_12 TaxID=1798002 RepID=A0A1F5SYX8_9BACT|nr:MAG: cyclopropane-fatty-acyl-phospholipid synthase [Candidatus Falkowbacteria bacterium RIFOXYC2_FULL_36_12]OGF34672.1 MAG: cyclopropane-fatty-acyl-phospholipid synthase [Candidatus Falkowbacteria bacterium RIFOXYA2_FULL_35_8]OGF46113.1 MAG: cyclopropane-fatty-acyl-phospholipid synthase [Candidatus Falkowbacteria bacterium RIFOXYD2_FULL_35_9]